MGTSTGPTGVRHTSGNPMHWPFWSVATGRPGIVVVSPLLLGVVPEVLGLGALGVGLANALELGPTHVGLLGLGPMKVGPRQVGLAELRLAEIRVREVGVGEVRPAEVG